MKSFRGPETSKTLPRPSWTGEDVPLVLFGRSRACSDVGLSNVSPLKSRRFSLARVQKFTEVGYFCF